MKKPGRTENKRYTVQFTATIKYELALTAPNDSSARRFAWALWHAKNHRLIEVNRDADITSVRSDT